MVGRNTWKRTYWLRLLPDDIAPRRRMLLLCLTTSSLGSHGVAEGNRTTPSYVAFNETERLIGDATKSQAAMNAHNTMFDAKRLIGRKFTDAGVQALTFCRHLWTWRNSHHRC